MKLNLGQLNKEVNSGVKSKIKTILTPAEFAQVTFDEVAGKLSWSAPDTIKIRVVDAASNAAYEFLASPSA